MEVREAVEEPSLPSFDNTVLFNDEGFEIYESPGVEGSAVGSVVELTMEDTPSSSTSKPPWQVVDGVRAVELLDSKCYRTPHGFQKEATFPCQPLLESTSSTSSFQGDGLESAIPPQEELQGTSEPGRRGPLEKFTLMIGDNILHFKIVKTNAEQNFSEVRVIPCSFCGKMFQSKSACEQHISMYHCDGKEFRCDVCGAIFSSKVSYSLHLRCHSAPRPYRCSVCAKSFARANTLSLHMKMHVTGHRHFCQICGRWFKTMAAMAEHESSCVAALGGEFVDTDRPYRWQCTYCDKMFHHRRDKNIHERVHTGEKPYTCGYCGKGFSQSQTLTIHIRTHTGEKPYPCGICGQEFRDSSALRKHEYRHNSLAPSSVVSPMYDSSAIEIGMDDDRLWNGRVS